MIYKFLKAIIFTSALGAAFVSKAEKNYDESNVIAKEVFAKIKNQFQAEKQAHGAMRILEMTEMCKKLPLIGQTTEQADKILKASGQKFDLTDVSRLTKNENEFAGGFILETNGFDYSAVFNIILHTSKIKVGKIDAVISCNVSTYSL